jgi:hypothetical protein
LGEWINSKFGDQGVVASKLKPPVAKNTVSSWVTGRNRVKPAYRKQLESLGFQGVWPEQEQQIAQAPAGEFTPREDYWKLVGRVETLERAVEKLGELVRDLVRESEESRRAARP